MKILAENFVMKYNIPKQNSFYGFQIMMENIHSETYSLLIDTYVKDDKEKDDFLKLLKFFQPLRKKQIGH